jgi:hypothetical protein
MAEVREMDKQRLFVAQVVSAIEEQWFAPGTDGPPIRTQRVYGIEQTLFAATDEEDAYRIVSRWLEQGNYADMNHDGDGDLTRYFGIGIHQLEEIETLDEFPAAVRDLSGVLLPEFSLADVDRNGVPLVREKDQLEVFRLRRITNR